MRLCFIPLMLLVVAISACEPAPAAQVNVAAEGFYIMDVQQLYAELQDKDFVMVNVHTPFEGSIAGTDLSIAYDEITQPQNLALLPPDKNARIVLYCRSGRMSAIAAKDLIELGYTNVWNVPGGMNDWSNAGYPLE